MPASATAVFALVVVAYVSQSRRLARLQVSAPISFTVIGAIVGGTLVRENVDPAVIRSLAEATLALVLFHDAAQVRPGELRADAALCARLLLVGLPLTILAGYGAARLLLPGASVWLALLLAAALAPTDAGLGAATVLNPIVPERVRRLLNVESGLNDGLATPVVLFAIAAAGSAESGHGHAAVTALRELTIGLAVGVVAGVVCSLLLAWAARSGFLDEGLLPVGVVMVPLVAYYGCGALHGNGFVAAFFSGMAYAAASDRVRPAVAHPVDAAATEGDLQLAEQISVILGYAVWALFGVVAVAHLPALFTWAGLAFALLSLTVLRMVPVALVLLGTGLRPQTVLFVGWFGPRGLASVVFALIAVEELSDVTALRPILGCIAMTVLLCVILHGVTAGPWAARFGSWAARVKPTVELEGTTPERR
jgi:NhaP-type Na+/H+ or K+/H+ antiporter